VRRVGQVRKRDWNEPAIVDALRAIGVRVWRLSGPGLPDLLTHYRGIWSVIEVKKPRGKLTDAQCNTRALAHFPVVETIDQALALFQVKR
jgi:Holliday junction resolvase